MRTVLGLAIRRVEIAFVNTITGPVVCSGAFAVGDSRNFTNSNNYLGRVDLTPSAKVGFSLKYNIQSFNQVQGGAVQQTSTYPGSGISLNGQNQNFSFNYVQNFGPLSANKFTFGWNRFSLNTLPVDSSLNASTYFQNLNFANQGLPSVLIGGYTFTDGPYANLGAAFNAPYSRVDSVWSVADNFSRSWGRHLFEAGGEFRYNRLNVNNEAAARGVVTFRGSFLITCRSGELCIDRSRQPGIWRQQRRGQLCTKLFRQFVCLVCTRYVATNPKRVAFLWAALRSQSGTR